MSRREERKAEIRQRILNACLSLLGQKSFQAITIKDICDEADIARKTLYSYFSSKEEMLDEVSQSVMYDGSISSFTNALTNHSSTRARLNDAFGHIGDPMQEYGEYIDVFIQLIQNLALRINANSEQLTAFHDAAFQFFDSCLQNDDTKDDVDARMIADLTVNALVGIILSWVSDQNYPAQERIEDLKQLIGGVILKETSS